MSVNLFSIPLIFSLINFTKNESTDIHANRMRIPKVKIFLYFGALYWLRGNARDLHSGGAGFNPWSRPIFGSTHSHQGDIGLEFHFQLHQTFLSVVLSVCFSKGGGLCAELITRHVVPLLSVLIQWVYCMIWPAVARAGEAHVTFTTFPVSFPCDAHIPHLCSLVRQSDLCSRPVHT